MNPDGNNEALIAAAAAAAPHIARIHAASQGPGSLAGIDPELKSELNADFAGGSFNPKTMTINSDSRIIPLDKILEYFQKSKKTAPGDTVTIEFPNEKQSITYGRAKNLSEEIAKLSHGPDNFLFSDPRPFSQIHPEQGGTSIYIFTGQLKKYPTNEPIIDTLRKGLQPHERTAPHVKKTGLSII